MLTSAQKNAIYTEIKKVYTVSATEFTIPVIYENQFNPERPSYPMIILKYVSTTDIISDLESIGVNSMLLSIHIHSKDYDNRPSGEFINGQVLADDITRQLMSDLNTNFNSDATLSGLGVKLEKKVKEWRDLSDIVGVSHVYHDQIDVNLLYEPS